MSGAAVIVALRVAATPEQAFRAFVEIGSWWTSHPLFALTPNGDGTLCFDPAGPGGRLITRFDDGEEWEIGQVHAWVPGKRLGFGWRLPSFAASQKTEVDVYFEPVGAETRVTVEHRGWDAIPQKHVSRHGFELMLFQRRLSDHWRALLAKLSRTCDHNSERRQLPHRSWVISLCETWSELA